MDGELTLKRATGIELTTDFDDGIGNATLSRFGFSLDVPPAGRSGSAVGVWRILIIKGSERRWRPYRVVGVG